MTLQQIRYILGVAEAGSLNKASEKLFISQPSLTPSRSLQIGVKTLLGMREIFTPNMKS